MSVDITGIIIYFMLRLTKRKKNVRRRKVKEKVEEGKLRCAFSLA